VSARVLALGSIVAAAVEGEVDGKATPADGDTRRGRRRSNRPATARFLGSWASDVGHKNQIEPEGVVELVEAI
jgi:hypothetical protein